MGEEFYIPKEKSPKIPWVWVAFGVVAFSGLAFLGWRYYVAKNPPLLESKAVIVNAAEEDMSDEWKTYENIKYGFTIKIPSTYSSLSRSDCTIQKTIDENATSLLLGSNCDEIIDLNISASTVDNWLRAHQNTAGWAMKDVNIGQSGNLAAKSIIFSKDNPFQNFSSIYIFENNGFLFELAETGNRLLLSEIASNINFDSISDPVVANKMKKFTSKQLKFEFEYPGTWKDIVMRKIIFEPSVYDKGVAYSSSYKENASEPITYDPERAYDFSVYSKDYARFPFPSPLNPQKVELNWTKEDFVKYMKPPADVLGVAQSGTNGLLVLMHNDYECSPSFTATIYIPVNHLDFPNFLINIDMLSVASDPIIKEYQDLQEKKGNDLCNTTEPYQKITDKILTNTYSDKIQYRIENARKIADSFKNLE